MRNSYLSTLLLTVLLPLAAPAQPTAWRPFQPGFIYGFTAAGGGTALHTLRVDSAYATADGDSVYAFNRLLRNATSSTYAFRKSRNNLFGARLRWQPGTADYYLEANAEPLAGTLAAVSLRLRPRAAVGSNWPASNGLTATLSSRALGPVAGGAVDSLVTITLSNQTQLVLSQHYGLVQGPSWLDLSGGSTWVAGILPQAGLGNYAPPRLFALAAGALIGYELEQLAFAGGLTCATGYRLRRILSRQQTADSLVFTYQQQDRVTYTNAPSCYTTPGTVLEPVRQGRWALSLRTGQSPQFPMLPRLSYGYVVSGNAPLAQRLWYNAAQDGGAALFQIQYGSLASAARAPDVFTPLLDATLMLSFTHALGPTQGYDGLSYRYQYYCPADGTCPPPAGYAGLLPTRAQQAATTATLYPNPATGPEPATLTLAAPAPPGTTATLLDALGRPLWHQPIPAGYATLPIPVASYPPGFYLLRLELPGSTPLTYPLNH